MEMQQIVIHNDGNITADEQDELMLKKVEELMNTGKIIGEARETLLSLSRNLIIRDLLLDSMGINLEQRKSMFGKVNQMLAERDAKILQKRKENEKGKA